MAGEPAPLAATQAAILKSVAGKAGQADPSASTQATAVRQDLSVMADQAKGYTAGVNAGVIDAQNNRAAQARRLAIEKQQADAARARDQQLAEMQTQSARLDQARQAQNYMLDRAKVQEKVSEPDVENANNVLVDAKARQSTNFQAALEFALSSGATNPADALAIYDNAVKNDDAPTTGRRTLEKYVREYFSALEGRAVNLHQRQQRSSSYFKPDRSSSSSSAPAGPSRRKSTTGSDVTQVGWTDSYR